MLSLLAYFVMSGDGAMGIIIDLLVFVVVVVVLVWIIKSFLGRP